MKRIMQSLFIAMSIGLGGLLMNSTISEEGHEAVLDSIVESIEIVESCSEKCRDCVFYPISKNQALRSDYVPRDIVGSGLNGGQEVSERIQKPLHDLFEKATELGVNMKINSGYRSYETQNQLFYYYVWNEQQANPGISYDDAIAKANVYSAKPGHSDHQLGYTVDVACSTCDSFKLDEKNKPVYEFLENYANDFGFVISYPDETTDQTGYKYEPWHIRYIGIKRATEYKQINEGREVKIPLEEYLDELCSIHENNLM
ncbi:M15 family metallopeptidase [Candidatus Dojkabacteria bacterium]|uniref:M15 family metallopeptidase n=1 Tax=Candidatus Dojkabacteria bacterium TaxID=2099670 RepID=A0A955L9G6_9BACT|nr:M15 family metallopeptidase [Candidatus Dojkabacteria bacterium]